MRYVDIGTVQPGAGMRPVAASSKHKKKSGSKWWRAIIGLGVMVLLVVAFYAMMPMAQSFLATTFKGSSSVLSWVVQGKQPLKEDGGKTNVLLLGIDKRADENYTFKGANGMVQKTCFRTDTMIVASYNHDTKKVTMLSLPRDLWVQLPAFGSFLKQGQKINAAYCFGDEYDYPDGGGMGLATKVVSDYLGIPIHYTARIDFAGFKQAIDAVGGVDINVENAFTDYQYPIEGKENAIPESARYKVVHFNAGLQHMDGETALEYARSRHAAGIEGSDFSRAKRQQKVIEAFKDKLFSPAAAANLQTLTQLYQSLGDSFATTATTADLPEAYDLTKTIDTSQTKSYNLDNDPSNPGGILTVPPAAQYGGAYVLVPDDGTFDQVRQFVQQIFSDNGLEPSPTPTAIGSLGN